MDSAILLLNEMGLALYASLHLLSIEWALWTALVFWLVYTFIHRSPFLRHLAWLMVLIKPATTLLAQSPIALYAPLSAILDGIVLSDEPQPPFAAAPSPMPDVSLTPATAAPLGVTNPTLDLFGYLAFAWLAGALFLLLRLVLGYAYVRYLRYGATPITSGPLHQLLQQTAAQLGMRYPVRLGLSAAAPSPLLTGIFRPVVLLPTRLKEQLSQQQLRLIFAHELAHVRRFDNLVLLGQRLVELVLFFHPATWLCNYHLRREAERACDDAVLRHYPDAMSYADSLARVAELRNGGVPKLLISTFAAAETQLGQRVRRILANKDRQRRLALSSVTFALLLAVGCVGLPAFLAGPKQAELHQDGLNTTLTGSALTLDEIEFELPQKQHVKLEIFDVRGTRTVTPLDREMSKGRNIVQWDGRDLNGVDAPEGLYFYRITTEGLNEVRKILLEREDFTLEPVPQLQRPRLLANTALTQKVYVPQKLYVQRDVTDTLSVMHVELEPQNGGSSTSQTFIFEVAPHTTSSTDSSKINVTMNMPKTLSAAPGTLFVASAAPIDSLTMTIVRTVPADSVFLLSSGNIVRHSGPFTGKLLMLKDGRNATGQQFTLKDGNIADSAGIHMIKMSAARDTMIFAIDPPINNAHTTDLAITFAMLEKSTVKLRVLNHMGTVVRTLIDDTLLAGAYTVNWDATDDEGNEVPPGVYFYQTKIGDKFKRIGKRIVQ